MIEHREHTEFGVVWDDGTSILAATRREAEVIVRQSDRRVENGNTKWSGARIRHRRVRVEVGEWVNE